MDFNGNNNSSISQQAVLDYIKGSLIQPANVSIGVPPNDFSFPSAVGSINQILKLNGSQQLIWANDEDGTPLYNYVVNPNLPPGNGNYTTIQSAITAMESDPSPQSPIFITNGTYTENLTISGSCHLIGSDINQTIIDTTITLLATASLIFIEKCSLLSSSGSIFVGSVGPSSGITITILNFVAIGTIFDTMYNFSNHNQTLVIGMDSIYFTTFSTYNKFCNIGNCPQFISFMESIAHTSLFTLPSSITVGGALWYMHNSQLPTEIIMSSTGTGTLNFDSSEIGLLDIHDFIILYANDCEFTSRPGLILGNLPGSTRLTNCIFSGTAGSPTDYNIKLSTFSNPGPIAISNVTMMINIDNFDPALIPFVTLTVQNYTFGSLKGITDINDMTNGSLLVKDLAGVITNVNYNVANATMKTNAGGNLYSLIPQFVYASNITAVNTVFAAPGVYYPVLIGVQVGFNSTNISYNAGNLVFTSTAPDDHFRSQKFTARFSGSCLALFAGLTDYHDFAWFLNGSIINNSITRVYIDNVRPTSVICMADVIFGGPQTLDLRVLSNNVANIMQATFYSISITNS